MNRAVASGFAAETVGMDVGAGIDFEMPALARGPTEDCDLQAFRNRASFLTVAVVGECGVFCRENVLGACEAVLPSVVAG
jgi:hypothetical protein